MASNDDRPDTALDKEMDRLATEFAKGLSALSSSSILRASLLKAAIPYLVIALEDEFPDCKDVIEEELENQHAILKAGESAPN